MGNRIMEQLQRVALLVREGDELIGDVVSSLEDVSEEARALELELEDIGYSVPDAEDFSVDCTVKLHDIEGLEDIEGLDETGLVDALEHTLREAECDMQDAFSAMVYDMEMRMSGAGSAASDVQNNADNTCQGAREVWSHLTDAHNLLQALLVELSSTDAAAELEAARNRVTELEAQNQSLREQLAQERARYRRMAYT